MLDPNSQRYDSLPADSFLPFELVFNPRWWHQTAGIAFTRDFYFDPTMRVRNDLIMRRVLHQRFGDIGMGEENPAPRPMAGSLHVAGGFIIPALLGAEIRFEPDAAPQALPALLSVEQLEQLETPDFREAAPCANSSPDGMPNKPSMATWLAT